MGGPAKEFRYGDTKTSIFHLLITVTLVVKI